VLIELVVSHFEEMIQEVLQESSPEEPDNVAVCCGVDSAVVLYLMAASSARTNRER
jgi:hypothetical protein